MKGSTAGKLIKHLCQTLGSFTYVTEATVNAKEVLGLECGQSEFWKIVIATFLDFVGCKRIRIRSRKNKKTTIILQHRCEI